MTPPLRYRLACILALLACGLLLVGTLIAMAHYPGGTPWNADTDGYSFCCNFLSDTGRAIARCGEPNPEGRWTFLATLVTGALLLVPYAWYLPQMYLEDRRRIALGRVLLLCSCLGMAVIGLAPFDTAPAWHMFGVLSAFLPVLFAIALYMWKLHGQKRLSRRMTVVFSILVALLVAHAAQGIVRQFTSQYTLAQPLTQKALVYCLLLGIIVNATLLLVDYRAGRPALNPED